MHSSFPGYYGLASNSSESKSKLAQVELSATTNTSSEFSNFVGAEYEKWGRVIKDANVSVQQ